MRRTQVLATILLLTSAGTERSVAGAEAPPLVKDDQRIVIFLFDGFGVEYSEGADMPVLKRMGERGFAAKVDAVMPTVTNVNNASLCTGVWPEAHGITGNSYFDEAAGRAEYMEDARSLRCPTIFERARARGVKSVLLTAKKKTVALLSRGTDLAIAAESPSAEIAARYGTPPAIYSRDINYWLWEVAIDLLKNRPDLRLIYVHTTDYPMHTWPPEAADSKEHLKKIDALLGRAIAAAPDAAFLITADHGLNAKSRCWDLAKACANRGAPVKFALSAERDRYVKHHRTFGGTAWVWLRSPDEAPRVTAVIAKLPGVESVLPRADAARRFHLMPERIGELVVLGDKETVFGEIDGDAEFEALPPTFRTHGSLHESQVPLILFNASGQYPPRSAVRTNFELSKRFFPEPPGSPRVPAKR
jgi:phosphonoacetate hydrolase